MVLPIEFFVSLFIMEKATFISWRTRAQLTGITYDYRCKKELWHRILLDPPFYINIIIVLHFFYTVKYAPAHKYVVDKIRWLCGRRRKKGGGAHDGGMGS